jgi:predicted DNA-binding transcriptional regulator AlpA
MKQRPEWVRIDAAVRLFGLSRSKLYELITDRKIKSFCLRERNKIKGIRLISFDSLSEFLENEAREQQEASE